ncbi:uncharacterized protein G2W53_043404 [Senna tora]|uniref:Uncharacterized protein n=1 Tax=Senna tora TaxID=362788 RepID=A0A834SHP7_9FABA|nr:uncharacterized protein G2W53_043404 [Senna tora]
MASSSAVFKPSKGRNTPFPLDDIQNISDEMSKKWGWQLLTPFLIMSSATLESASKQIINRHDFHCAECFVPLSRREKDTEGLNS